MTTPDPLKLAYRLLDMACVILVQRRSTRIEYDAFSYLRHSLEVDQPALALEKLPTSLQIQIEDIIA